jgi:hypothetical protein
MIRATRIMESLMKALEGWGCCLNSRVGNYRCEDNQGDEAESRRSGMDTGL